MDPSSLPLKRPVFYLLSAFGREFQLNVSSNHRLLSPSYQVEFWREGGVEREQREREREHHFNSNCIYTGHIVHDEQTSTVTLNNCAGLMGVFTTEHEEFFVEPLWNDTLGSSGEGGGGRGGRGEGDEQEERGHQGQRSKGSKGQRHVIYRRILTVNDQNGDRRFDCGNTDDDGLRESSLLSNKILTVHHHHKEEKKKKNKGQKRAKEEEEERERSKSDQRIRMRRSVSRENFVETLIVVDPLMVKYHGRDAIESYILTVMNIVAKLFRDASIGNDINIVVSKIIILGERQKDLDITYHADRSLENFCRWQHQHSANATTGTKWLHYDAAILITRLDICLHQDQPCGTLGLAPVGGMCDPFRSCSIIEDIGIATAYTIAHELGHSLGMQHDGTLNSCGLSDQEPARLMAFQLTKNTEPFTWSSCSRDYITDFLDSGKGDCLRNSPDEGQLKMNKVQPLPGQLHSADTQCKYQFGPKSTQCNEDGLDICRELWCLNPSNHCVTNSIPAAEGTRCSSPMVKHGWCYQGSCMKVDWRPKVVDGRWGDWSPWSGCTRSCGGGVQVSERSCSNPKPQHGGKYCVGERRRYKSCNIFNCPENSTDFREIQCAKFNNELFRGKYYKWKPFTGGATGKDFKPCALTCMAVNHHFYTERAAKVIDGTRCHQNSLDMCIDGKCEHVGCDGVLGSEAREDKCRVCNGDGRRCRTVTGIFDQEVDVGGESYVEAVRIPKGAMNILVIERNLSHNYLALKSEGRNARYHVNGEWTIDWPRQFEIADTSFAYERPKEKPESLQALGPTSEDLTVMLLLQEKNKGILYEYSLPLSSANEYDWRYEDWSPCSATCGGGVSQQKVICVRISDLPRLSSVDERNCQSIAAKYEHKKKFCNEEPCPPEWVVGNWSECSKTCEGGWKTRLISCVQRVNQGSNEVIEHKNCSSKKPKSRRRCNRQKCPFQWKFDNWSSCQPSCGNGTRTRNVYCESLDGKYAQEQLCDPLKRPTGVRSCRSSNCPWRTGPWSECSVSCGLGKQMRTVTCRTHGDKDGANCDKKTMPASIQDCSSPCEEDSPPECKDINDTGYCPLVVKFKFCNRPYFHQICCKTCSEAGH